MNNDKSGLVRNSLKKKKRNETLGFNSKEKIYNKPVLHPQPEYCLKYSTFSFGVQEASVFFLHCFSGERGNFREGCNRKAETRGKSNCGTKRSNKVSTLSRLILIPGSPTQHTAALNLSRATHISQAGLSAVFSTLQTKPDSAR